MFSMTQNNFDQILAQYFDIIERAGHIISPKMAYDVPSTTSFSEASISRQKIAFTGVSDYVRWRSLDLVRELIESNKVAGSVAEAGVWMGAFARLVNYCFPDRKIYLFDTFEGFVPEQLKKDHQAAYVSDFFMDKQHFDNSSVDIVMQNMLVKEQCVICKGDFKQESEKIDDTFAFVSLDMDLYEPTMVALEYFYPRLNPGGYIFLHDYNHSGITGIKQCVQDFISKASTRIPLFPLPDEGGTVVLTK